MFVKTIFDIVCNVLIYIRYYFTQGLDKRYTLVVLLRHGKENINQTEGANMVKSITVRFHEAGRKFYFTDKGMVARSSRNGIEKAHMLFEAVEDVTGRQYHFGTKRFIAFARGFNGACSHDGERTMYA